MGLEKQEEKYDFGFNFTFLDLVPLCNFIFGFDSSKWLTKYHLWHISDLFVTSHAAISVSVCHTIVFETKLDGQGLKATRFAHSWVYLE
jgi:hypothetical protein